MILFGLILVCIVAYASMTEEEKKDKSPLFKDLEDGTLD